MSRAKLPCNTALRANVRLGTLLTHKLQALSACVSLTHSQPEKNLLKQAFALCLLKFVKE